MSDIPKVDLTGYAKNKYIKFTWVLDKDDNITENSGVAYGAFKFTLIDPPENFTGRLNFHWTNRSGEPTRTCIEVTVENGILMNVYQQTDILNFQGLSGSLQLPHFHSYPGNSEISYVNNVLLLPIYKVKVGTQKGLIKDHIFFHETSDDYFASDLVVYRSDLSEYVKSTDLPTDHVTESSLANTLTNYMLKSDLPTDHVTESSLATTLTDYAKSTRVMEYTFDRPEGTTQFMYTLTKPSNNFSLKITLRWVNGDGEDDWYTGTADVVNGKLTNKKGYNTYQTGSSMKYFTFQGIDGRTGCRPTTYLYYSKGVITFAPMVCGDGVRDQVWTLINYDPEETCFIESMVYDSDLYDYALKSDIPTDHVTESSLTNTLSEYALKSELPTDYVTESLTVNSSELRDRVGMINVNTTVDDQYVFGQAIYAPNFSNGHHVISAIGLAKRYHHIHIWIYQS